LEGMEYNAKGIKELVHNRRTYIEKIDMALRLREEVQVQNTLTYIKQTVHPMVLPRMWKATVIQQFHNEMGHPGTRRMLSTIGRYYTWSGMQSDIHHFCQTCIQCQKRMSANQIVKNPKLSIYPLMTRPFERVHIVNYLLRMVDTTMCWSLSVRSQNRLNILR
jgi:7-cyano-7-deazaguanine synthase in queuosine biosynthesis